MITFAIGVSITNILYFFTEEELLDIKEIATKINGKAVVDPNRTDRWCQLSQLLLERMVAASGESLAEEGNITIVTERFANNSMKDLLNFTLLHFRLTSPCS